MSVDLFLILLTFSTTATIILTEGMKWLLIATETPHRNNVIAGFCAAVASTGVGVIYRVPFGLGFSSEQLLRLVLLIIFTWLLSMVVYDKGVQTKEQHERYRGGKF